MNTNELSALITLIEDPDETVYSEVRRELELRGEQILPQLENWWESHDFGPLFQRRLEELIQTIQYKTVFQRLKEWKENPEAQLLEGWLILNRYQYPSFDEYELKRQVSKIRQGIWLELNDELTALETVKVFNYILYNLQQFHAPEHTDTDPQYHYLSDVLSSRCGNHIALAMLYLALAESLDIPIYGVDAPSKVLMCYANPVFDDLDELDQLENIEDLATLEHLPEAWHEDILFYINASEVGKVIARDEVIEAAKKKNPNADGQPLLPCTHQALMIRMVQSLIHSYEQSFKPDKVRELQALVSVLLEQ
ncbi:MAG: transglutaminase family protein [Flavobacteriales bacterium]|nr:transglutaminase family protein [Flavobacteriales bacterium]